MTQVAIRLPTSMLPKLDAIAIARSRPGDLLTRSDAMRLILQEAIDAHEKRPPKK